MKNYEVLIKGAGISIVGLILSKIISYLTTVVIAKTGSSILGLLNLGLSIVSFIAMISLLGLSGGVLRYVSYYLGKNDKKRIKGVMQGSLKISLITGIITSILVFIFSYNIAVDIFKKPELVNVIRVFAFIIPLLIATEIFSSIMLSFKKIQYNVIIRDLTERVFRFLIVIIFIYLGFSLNWIALGYVLGSLLTCILFLNLLRKKEFVLFDKKVKPDLDFKELIIYSLPLILVSLLSLLQKWADIFILGFYRSTNEIGVYSIAFSTASLLAIIPTALMSLFTPITTSLYAKNKIKDIKKINTFITKWIFTFNLPFLLILIFFSKNLLRVVFGNEYLSGYLALTILGCSYLLLSLTHVYSSNLLIIKKTKLLSVLVLISTLSNIILNILLVPKYGINGAAISTLIATVLFLILVMIYAFIYVRIQPLKLYFIKPLISGILAIIIMKYIYNLLPDKFLILIFSSLIMLIIYYGLLILFKSFSKEDLELIKTFKDRLKNLINR